MDFIYIFVTNRPYESVRFGKKLFFIDIVYYTLCIVSKYCEYKQTYQFDQIFSQYNFKVYPGIKTDGVMHVK